MNIKHKIRTWLGIEKYKVNNTTLWHEIRNLNSSLGIIDNYHTKLNNSLSTLKSENTRLKNSLSTISSVNNILRKEQEVIKKMLKEINIGVDIRSKGHSKSWAVMCWNRKGKDVVQFKALNNIDAERMYLDLKRYDCFSPSIDTPYGFEF